MTFTFNKFRNYAMVALAALALASCSNDDFMNDTPSLKAEGMATAPQGILPGVQPANGAWVTSSISKFFRGYYKSHGNNLPSSFSLTEGDWTKYSPGGRAFNGSYYTLNNTKTGQRGIRKITVSGSSFSSDVTLQTSSKAIEGQKDEVNFTLFDATHGYYTDGEADGSYGKIGTFNPSTMQEGPTLDVGTKVENRLKIDVFGDNQNRLENEYKNLTYKKIGTKLLIRRGNYLYADVTFGNDRNQLNQIKQSTDNVYVAVINVASSTPVVEKILIGTAARNIGLFNDHPLVCIDPVSKAIYFATVSEMDKKYGPEGKAGEYSKIFKIIDTGNAVPSEITPVKSYKEANNNSSNEGEFNTLYAYNNTVYTKVAFGESIRYTDFGWHGQNYRRDIWQYVMISPNGSVSNINIPKDNFYAYQQPQLINGKIYMISNSNQGSKVYKVNFDGTNATEVTTGVAGGLGWGWATPDKISSIVKL